MSGAEFATSSSTNRTACDVTFARFMLCSASPDDLDFFELGIANCFRHETLGRNSPKTGYVRRGSGVCGPASRVRRRCVSLRRANTDVHALIHELQVNQPSRSGSPCPTTGVRPTCLLRPCGGWWRAWCNGVAFGTLHVHGVWVYPGSAPKGRRHNSPGQGSAALGAELRRRQALKRRNSRKLVAPFSWQLFEPGRWY